MTVERIKIDKELLEKAMALDEKEHPLGGPCAECAELGRAMYESRLWSSVEEQWVALLGQSFELGPAKFVECAIMFVKYGIQVGLAMSKVAKLEEVVQ